MSYVVHAQWGTPEYRAWSMMKSRCLSKTSASYPDYGARGITVCERWMAFPAFLEDMGRRPTAKHSLDRIDNDGNYEPGNCRWATHAEQRRNLRKTVYAEYQGERLALGTIYERAAPSISYKTFWYRVARAGWPIDAALTAPLAAGIPLPARHPTTQEAR